MTSTPTGRAIAVTLIGWLCIAGSVAALLSGSLTLLTFPLARATTSQVSGGRPWIPPVLAVFSTFLDRLWVAALLEIGLAAFGLFAAVRFLGRRSWARAALELLAWLWLVFMLTRAVDWIALMLALGSAVAIPAGGRALGLAVGALVAVVLGALRAVPAIVLITVVRHRAVREAMVR